MIRLKGFGQFLDLDAGSMSNELVLVSDDGRELRLPISPEALEQAMGFVDGVPSQEEEEPSPAPVIPDTGDALLGNVFPFPEMELGTPMDQEEHYRVDPEEDLHALMEAAHGDLGEA